MPQSGLAAEWAVLQQQYDSYEKFSLLIKLFAIGLLATLLFTSAQPLLIALLLLLWLQDAIWKTFQARIDARLQVVEEGLAAHAPSPESLAFQYNRQFALERPGPAGLLGQYLRQALRPTVAYPHLLLVMLATLSVLG
jgi:hypothetical protein